MKKFLQILLIISVLILTLSSCDIFKISFGEGNGENGGDVTDNENTEQGGTEEDNSCKHNFVIDEAKAPTCTEEGLTEGKHCTLCGVVEVAQVTVPASHTYGEWEVISNGNCFLLGEQKRICTICEHEDFGVIATTAHSFIQNENTGLFTCDLCSAVIFAGHLYAPFTEEVNWFDAYKMCESMGGHLVTVTSEDEQMVLNQMIEAVTIPEGAGTEYYFWNGLIRNSDGWHWITGEEVGYTFWSSKEPDNSGSTQWFVAMAKRVVGANAHAKLGQWEDCNLNSVDAFICEWELDIVEDEHYFTEWKITESDCFSDGVKTRYCTNCGIFESLVIEKVEHSFLLNEEYGIEICEHCGAGLYNGHIYKIFETKLSWFDAYSYCKDLGGHLATVTSAEEQAFINAMMKSDSYSAKTWLGGYNDSNGFKWVTDEEFEYGSWQSGQPNSADDADWFVIMNTTFGQWNDYPPLEKAYFLCEWES